GAWKTMKRGVEELQKRSESGIITAQTLAELARERIVEAFDLGIRTQENKRTADTTIELEPLVNMILAVAHDSGRRLLDMGFPDFASFVYSHYRHPENGDPSATWLVHQLATCFPAFNDRRNWHGGMEVLFLKKAQIAVAELHQRFGDQNPAIFTFPDKDRLTVVCDNVLPCVLRTLGVLVLPDKLLQKIDSKQPLPAGPDEAELRAKAITAAELMIEHGNGQFWAKELGDYLWSLGKDPHYRSVERHATPDTCFY
ncbi:MAG: queuosine salvage family protein, partial [Desulfobacteria bacterium]